MQDCSVDSQLTASSSIRKQAAAALSNISKQRGGRVQAASYHEQIYLAQKGLVMQNSFSPQLLIYTSNISEWSYYYPCSSKFLLSSMWCGKSRARPSMLLNRRTSRESWASQCCFTPNHYNYIIFLSHTKAHLQTENSLPLLRKEL